LDLRADPGIFDGSGVGRTGIGVADRVRVLSRAVDGAVTTWSVIDRFDLEDIVGTIFPPTADLALVGYPDTGVTANAGADPNTE